MGRPYKRQPGARRYADYTDEQLQEALQKIRSQEMSQRAAEEMYNIPRSTLKRKLKGLNLKKAGGQAIIDAVTERKFADYIITCSMFGFPLDSFDIRVLVKTHLDSTGVAIKNFKNNFPGVEWFRGFMKRNSNLTERMSANIKKQRAKISPQILNVFYDHLENELEGIPASHIYNFDETNLTDDPGKKKIITKRGLKYPERILNTTKSSTSLMMCGNAEGHTLPPYVVYKSKEMWTTWTEGGPPGCRYNRTLSGWFDAASFEDWFVSLVLPHLKRQAGTKVLIGDNLSSHLNIKTIELCRLNNIKFICLPPNSTHLTQPLDLAYFRPMKGEWRKILLEYKLNTGKSPIPKSDFPKLLKKLIAELSKDQTALINGFRKAGIAPLNRSEVITRLPTGTNLPDSSTNPEDDLASRVSDSVLNFLQNKRYGEGGQQAGRKKKIAIEPGKSVTEADFSTTTQDAGPSSAGPSSAGPSSAGPSSAGPSSAGPSGMAKGKQVLQNKKKSKVVSSEQKKKKSRVVSSDFSDESESDYSVHSEFEDESFDEEDFYEELGKEKSKNMKVSNKVTNDKVTVNASDLTMNSYVIVKYEGEFFPGVIEDVKYPESEVEEREFSVSTMIMSGHHWKWPDRKDTCWYKETDIAQKIDVPVLVNTRGTFAVPSVAKWQQKNKT